MEKTKVLMREKAQIEKEQVRLKEAVLKSIMGEGEYPAELLNEMLETKNTELADAAEKLTAMETIKNELQQQLAANKEIVENLDTWETRFDAASLEQKKGILLNIIDKILVFPHGIRTDYKIETRGFGTLQAIDRPDWLAEPTSEIALAQISENSKIEPNTAPYYTDSGVNHTPQANKRIQMYKLLLHSDNKNHSDTKDRKRQIIFSRQKKRYLQCG